MLQMVKARKIDELVNLKNVEGMTALRCEVL